MGDIAERHFIELKSEIDPTSKDGAAKVAKFILGAAHRDPDRAAKYLGGYAVMILGVAHNDVRGLPRFETKDISAAVQQYLGEPGPRWDFTRVRVDDDHEVIVIIIDPPVQGEIWPCCREGNGLVDGRIYIRADGETREANHDEIRALVARTRAGDKEPGPDLVVRLRGVVNRFHLDPSVCDEYIAGHRQRLEALAPTENPPSPSAAAPRQAGVAGAAESLAASIRRMTEATTEPGPRSREEYFAEIDDWEARVRRLWRGFASNFAFSLATTRVEACSQSYLEEVKVKIHLDGAVRALEGDEEEWARISTFDSLPTAPRPWGPRSMLPFATIDPASFPLGYDYLPSTSAMTARPYSRYDNVNVENTNSVDISVLIEELRPEDAYISGDEFTLWLNTDDENVTGTWTVTAKRHHTQYSGELQIEVCDPIDITEALRAHLRAQE
ncbi:hypothetical protein A9X02_27795 [Mycobacterium malmoense]|nr:hypothetical protein A9X02_27795 [Mycobacterium malmoense]